MNDLDALDLIEVCKQLIKQCEPVTDPALLARFEAVKEAMLKAEADIRQRIAGQ